MTTATIATTRPVPVTKYVSRKIARNATVKEAVYQDASRTRAVAMASVMTLTLRDVVAVRFTTRAIVWDAFLTTGSICAMKTKNAVTTNVCKNVKLSMVKAVGDWEIVVADVHCLSVYALRRQQLFGHGLLKKNVSRKDVRATAVSILNGARKRINAE